MEINFSLLGVGKIGVVHAWASKAVSFSFDDINPEKIHLVGVYNRTVTKAEWAKKRFGFEYYTGDWKKILEDGKTNAVSITLPNVYHEEPVIAFAERGVHILCEKPIAATFEQAKRMYDIVSKTQVITIVPLVMRFMPTVAYVRELIEKGKLGKITHFRGVVGHSRYVNPDLPIEWRMKKAIAGGGALADVGIHLMDLARYLIGDIKELIARTKTFIKKRKTKDGKEDVVDVDDAGILIMEFENGALGSIEASRMAPGFTEQQRIEIHGTKGGVRFALVNPFKLQLFEVDSPEKVVKEIELKPWKHALWPPGKSVSGWGYLFVPLFHEFFTAILENRKAKPDLEDALKAQEILEAAYRSAEERRWISLPL